MSLRKIAARLRHGFFCALVSSSLLWSSHASAGTSPVISGAPPTTASVGKLYSFQPAARDPNGLKVTFQVWNKPSWATFDSATGRLYGTPGSGNVGAYHWVQIAASDGSYRGWLPAYTITVSAATSSSTGGGTTPVISGTPPTTATVGSAYSFQPTASIPNGQTIRFEVFNKPSWATFDSATGRLYGTPDASNVGTYHWVQIAAINGQHTSWLPSYTLTVSAGSLSSAGTVTVGWTPPTENTDGSTLSNLAGYHIYYGTSQSSLTHVVNITNPGLATYVVSDLTAATWYFAVTSVNANGTESPRSAVVTTVVQ